jgi:hypothetical protein
VLTAPLLVALLASQAEPCVPGRQVTCSCGGGVEGFQTCNADGASFGPCACEEETYQEEAYEEEEDYGPDPRDPRYLPYEEEMEIPPGYELTQRIRTGWLITGISVFAGLYLYTAVIVTTDGTSGDSDALIPGIGPIIAAATSGGGFNTIDGVLIADGLVQLTAIAVAIWAIVDQRQLLVREDLAITPLLMPDGGGVALGMTF